MSSEKEKLIVFDTTLRDGEQSPGASMTKEEKLRIAKLLERMKVDVIEAGFAISSQGDFEAIQLISEHVHQSIVCSLSRAITADIHRAGEALKKANAGRIHKEGSICVGMILLPRNDYSSQEKCKTIVENELLNRNYYIYRWRQVPVNTKVLGEKAENNRPEIVQVIFKSNNLNLKDDDLLLMLDYGIFYEFIPIIDNKLKYKEIVSIEDVKLNVNYAMIISTNGGLWRYNIGDTIIFTSLDPYKIKISGRTKHFINAFGEELMVSSTDLAIQITCEKTKCKINIF